jgi:hypothetical protein
MWEYLHCCHVCSLGVPALLHAHHEKGEGWYTQHTNPDSWRPWLGELAADTSAKALWVPADIRAVFCESTYDYRFHSTQLAQSA